MIGQANNKIWAALASNLVCKLEYASWLGLAITTYSLDPNKIAINQPNGCLERGLYTTKMAIVNNVKGNMMI